jgi:ubiquitin carboxyl-terminal hydrolase L3
MSTENKDEWLGIESNPEVLNEFAQKLGLDVAKYSFHDVWVCADDFTRSHVQGLDDDLLACLPQPVVTMILLFPSKCKVKFDESKRGDDSNLFFLRQVHALDDACGTIAMVHSISNNVDLVGLGEGALKSYVDTVKDKSAEERGQALADNQAIHDFHHSFCKQGNY